MFDYDCAPLWLSGDFGDGWDNICGDWLVNREGYFESPFLGGEGKVPETRLKGETELEQKVKLIFEIYCRIWDINEFPDGEPYLGFADEQEMDDFYDACEYVIKQMKELFGDEFIVHESAERRVKERLFPLKPSDF